MAKPVNPVYHISWTWNKPTNATFQDGEFEAFHMVIKERLEAQCKTDKFVFQLERGEQGRLHYQGYIKLAVKERPLAWAKKVRGFMPGIHVSATSRDGSTNAEFYVMKEDTRVSGPYADKNHIIPDFSEYKTPLTGWLVEAEKMLLQPPNSRKIIWIWEEEGCTGKSHFATYMEVNHSAIGLGLGTANDNFYAVSELAARSYIFDIPRTLPKRFDWSEVYMSLEKIKDRNFLSTKYKPKKVLLPVVPHVMVLANYPPKRAALSKDRWEVWKCTSNGLVPDNTEGTNQQGQD